MNLSKTKGFILLILLAFAGKLSAQEINYNRWSAELTTGIHVPFSPKEGVARSKYIDFKQFQLSGRYMFSEEFGLKGHYGFNQFANRKNHKEKLEMHRIGLEGVANIGKLLNVDYRVREKVNLLVHSGLGISFANSPAETGTDHTGNILVGLTGEIKISNRLTLLTDATYIANFKQHFGYNGIQFENGNSKTGSFLNLSIGIMYSFGKKGIHADWY